MSGGGWGYFGTKTQAAVNAYVNYPRYVLYILGLPLAIATYLLLKQCLIKYFFISWAVSIVPYVIAEILFTKLGFINMFSFIGVAIGVIAAFINTCVVQNKATKDKK